MIRYALPVFVALCLTRAEGQCQTKSGIPRDSIPASVRLPQFLSDIRAEVAPIYEMGHLPEPLGLMRLDSSVISPGAREIRLYAGSIAGYPATGLVISDVPGRTPRVKGRAFRYWPVNDKQFTEDVDLEARYAEGEAGRCAKPVRGKTAVTCDILFERQPDWSATLQKLDSLDAWNLPDERKVPRRNVMMIHGWRIRAESKRDTVYRLWWYDNPQLFRPPEGQNAHAIMRLVYGILDSAKTPSNIVFARGIYLFGPDTSDFAPCDKLRESGYAEGMLTPVSRIIGDSAWKARSGPTQAFVIEGWFHRNTSAPFNRGSRKFERQWYVDTLTSVKPANGRACR